MHCNETEQLIWRKRDGELDAAERVRLEEHLAQCAACRAAAEVLDFHVVWQRRMEPQIPLGFAERVARHTAEDLPSPFWAVFESLAARFVPVAIAAVLLLGIGLVTLIQRDLRQQAEWSSYETLTAAPDREAMAVQIQSGTFAGFSSENNTNGSGGNREK